MAETNVAPIGKESMESIEYLGNQMNFTITGDSTGAKYTFGKDRPKGWVFMSDVGTREGKLGFLSKRENGKWLYQIAGADTTSAPEPVVGVAVTIDQTPTPVETVVVEPTVSTELTGAQATSTSTGTLTAVAPTTTTTAVAPTIATPNPTDLTVEEIKAYADKGLTKDQWEEMYGIEMANRNRKGAVSFMEELLANWKG